MGQEETVIDMLEQASQLLEGLSSDIYTPFTQTIKKMPAET